MMILDYVVRFPALWAAFILLINDKINCNIKGKFDVCRWKLRKCHPTQLISDKFHFNRFFHFIINMF